MSVYITHAGSLLGIPTEEDLPTERLCDGDCRQCLVVGTNSCPVRMRRFEAAADGWMLGRSMLVSS